jgi:Mrp family chromosome partitioning ATPase
MMILILPGICSPDCCYEIAKHISRRLSVHEKFDYDSIDKRERKTMSKNFELMQRAGKLLEIEVPPPVETVGPPTAPPMAPEIAPTLAPAFTPSLAQPRIKKWRAGHLSKRLTVDQIAREESHRLVQQIFMMQTQEAPRVVVFAGIDHGNGCSRMCAHTAEALRENVRGSICIVEANFRSPSLPKFYGNKNHYGLTDALLGEGPIRSFAKPLGNDNLYLMSCGSLLPDYHVLLNSNRLKSRFREMRIEFDYVVVDSPPMTRYSDAIALGKVSDGVVLVLEANETRREAAIRVSEQLRASQIRILGAVLNKRTFPIPESLYKRL